MTSDFSQKNPFSRSYTAIIEFTINCPENKNYTEEKYKDVIKKVLSSLPEDYPLVKEPQFFIEKCKSGKLHLHGMFPCKDQNFYVEGLVSDISKFIIQAIDKRMRHNFDANYYRLFKRYRTPTVCVQYSDELPRLLHWEEYIRKDQI